MIRWEIEDAQWASIGSAIAKAGGSLENEAMLRPALGGLSSFIADEPNRRADRELELELLKAAGQQLIRAAELLRGVTHEIFVEEVIGKKSGHLRSLEECERDRGEYLEFLDRLGKIGKNALAKSVRQRGRPKDHALLIWTRYTISHLHTWAFIPLRDGRARINPKLNAVVLTTWQTLQPTCIGGADRLRTIGNAVRQSVESIETRREQKSRSIHT